MVTDPEKRQKELQKQETNNPTKTKNKKTAGEKYVEENEEKKALVEKHRKNCKCCGLDPEAKLIPLCASLDQLSFLGPGYVLFFGLIKGLFVITALLGVYSISKILDNYHGGNCVTSTPKTRLLQITNTDVSNVKCTKDWISWASVANYGISRVDETEKVKKKINKGGTFLLFNFFIDRICLVKKIYKRYNK